MDFIKYTSTLKASGKKYEKIVFWNRFWRNKTELILTLLPAAASIALFSAGFHSTLMLMIYVIAFVYPFMVFSQCRSSIRYHLKNRDASESAPCEITLMATGILAEIPDYETIYTYRWDEFTTIYDVLGYYMMFHKGTMIVMLNKADIPPEYRTAVVDFIFAHIDANTCYARIRKKSNTPPQAAKH